jgi:transcriptional regulator with XRE-family HTH domain
MTHFGDRRGKEWTLMAKKAPNPTDHHVGSQVRMRRMMLGMSQEKLGDALGLTFQQVQKYEKGTNRIGASRLQQISHILQVPVEFFFEGAPHLAGLPAPPATAPSPAYVSDFLATADGLSLTKAFMRIGDAKLRRLIVNLVQHIAGQEDGAGGTPSNSWTPIHHGVHQELEYGAFPFGPAPLEVAG